MKTKDIEIRKDFAKLHPKDAKQKGRTIKLRNDWESIKYEVVFLE
jgi:predicted NAD-dependent protein-ADP-ribosyltransferase YbiA (DUF1768 family)